MQVKVKGTEGSAIRTVFAMIKRNPYFSARVFVFVIIKIGQNNGLHPTLSEQPCTEQEDLRNIVLSNVAVSYTIANL